MTRPDTITLAGVELRTRSPGGNVYWSDDGRIAMWRWGREDRWYADAFGSRVGPSDTPESLDAATRAALVETFRALLPLVPEVEAIRAEERERIATERSGQLMPTVEAIRAEERERCAVECDDVAYLNNSPVASGAAEVCAARIRALGPVQ